MQLYFNARAHEGRPVSRVGLRCRTRLSVMCLEIITPMLLAQHTEGFSLDQLDTLTGQLKALPDLFRRLRMLVAYAKVEPREFRFFGFQHA